jgi:hypothetical protein
MGCYQAAFAVVGALYSKIGKKTHKAAWKGNCVANCDELHSLLLNRCEIESRAAGGRRGGIGSAAQKLERSESVVRRRSKTSSRGHHSLSLSLPLTDTTTPTGAVAAVFRGVVGGGAGGARRFPRRRRRRPHRYGEARHARLVAALRSQHSGLSSSSSSLLLLLASLLFVDRLLRRM